MIIKQISKQKYLFSHQYLIIGLIFFFPQTRVGTKFIIPLKQLAKGGIEVIHRSEHSTNVIRDQSTYKSM